ncbi:MAG: hypothetical protein IPI07_02735 [Flavobacteriales bacterium]|nr:hypothetical protein [Flavobacteriales bacterium]
MLTETAQGIADVVLGFMLKDIRSEVDACDGTMVLNFGDDIADPFIILHGVPDDLSQKMGALLSRRYRLGPG